MQVEIEKIVPEGRSLAHLSDGKVVFVWGGLPGEIVDIKITKNKKTFAEAEIVTIIKNSPDRLMPAENHYLICSPWQVVPHKKQIELKKQLLMDSFRESANENITINKFYESPKQFGYRTKMEYSFTTNTAGKITLAFHKRGVNNEYEVIDGCMLGSDKVNAAAQKITDVLNTMPDIEAKGLKSLTIRESKTDGQIIAILLHKFREYEINIKLLDLGGLIDGLYIGYSTIKSPVSVITELKYHEGAESLTENISGITLQYPYDGFFQNNIPVFEKALQEIRDAVPDYKKITELYSGVGTIGLSLVDKAKEVRGIEINESAVRYAQINANNNKINNYSALTLPDHKISSEYLSATDVLVLDPPRSGLHPKTTALILNALPQTIVYLSCNPNTQARDYALLRDKYEIKRVVGFDFYPNTVHLESLIVLELK